MSLNVIIGAGEQRWTDWVPTQQGELDLLEAASFDRYFADRRADALLCEHTWEHLGLDEAVLAARTCFTS